MRKPGTLRKNTRLKTNWIKLKWQWPTDGAKDFMFVKILSHILSCLFLSPNRWNSRSIGAGGERSSLQTWCFSRHSFSQLKLHCYLMMSEQLLLSWMKMEKVACRSYQTAHGWKRKALLNVTVLSWKPTVRPEHFLFPRQSLKNCKVGVVTICEEKTWNQAYSTCLKFSLRKPYMTGFVQTEVMARRWHEA